MVRFSLQVASTAKRDERVEVSRDKFKTSMSLKVIRFLNLLESKVPPKKDMLAVTLTTLCLTAKDINTI